jgi:exoribonuclease R
MAQDNHLCGVLIVDGITYGRQNDKLLYKCIPDDRTLPHLLIPYEDKSTAAFSKVKTNKYVTVRLTVEKEKETYALSETFGDVDDLEAYIQYQLACKKMHGGSSSGSSSIKPLHTATLRALREKPFNDILNHYYLIEDRHTWPIISIDPLGCQDIDDAIGIRLLPDGQTLLSIYISNVPFMLDYLNLWPMVSDRISTIYFSHKKVPMLPFLLSENKLSLLQGEERIAFALDIYIYAGAVKKIEIINTLIKVEKNYEYEASALLKRSDYKDMLRVVKQLNQDSFRYLSYIDEVKDSHTLVEFCMIMMNHECAKLLRAKKKGIFRSATKKEALEDKGTDYKQVIKTIPELAFILQGVAGEYCSAQAIKPHELIGSKGGLECYVHITSPIRRMVDIINMLELQMGMGITSKGAEDFLLKWTTQEAIDLINKKTKAIRRLQNDVELLKLYDKNNVQVYSGISLGGPPPRDGNRDGCDNFKSVLCKDISLPSWGGGTPVYIPELKLLTKIYSTKNLPIYSSFECTVHLFLDEAKMSKKVRLQML